MVRKHSECQSHLLQPPLFVAEEVELPTGSDIGDVLPQSKGGAPRWTEGAGWRQIRRGRSPVWTFVPESFLLCAWLLPLLPLDLSVDGDIAVLLVQNGCKGYWQCKVMFKLVCQINKYTGETYSQAKTVTSDLNWQLWELHQRPPLWISCAFCEGIEEFTWMTAGSPLQLLVRKNTIAWHLREFRAPPVQRHAAFTARNQTRRRSNGTVGGAVSGTSRAAMLAVGLG